MPNAIERLKDHLTHGTALTEADWDAILDAVPETPRCDLALALIALSDDPLGPERWFERNQPAGVLELSPVERFVFVSVDDPEVDELVDYGLESDDAPAVAKALVRGRVPWAHARLTSLLDDPAGRFAAAWLLAEQNEGTLHRWLTDNDVVADVLDALRAVALSGATTFWEEAAEWYEIVDTMDRADEGWARALAAHLAIVNPDAYARRVFLGEARPDWLNDSRAVADFLQTYSTTDWLDTLAILEATNSEEAFEFAALLAVCGAQATVGEEIDDDEADQLLALHERASQDPSGLSDAISGNPLFGFAVGVGDDEDLIALLVEAAIHERLRIAGFPAPGLSGLPLAASTPEWLDLDEARQRFETLGAQEDLSPEDTVVLVRTLCDLRDWVRLDPETVSPDWAGQVAQRLAGHSAPPVVLAARCLQATLSGEAPAGGGDGQTANALLQGSTGRTDAIGTLRQLAEKETVAGLTAVQHLLSITDDEALEAIVQLWADGPLARAPHYVDAFTAVLLGPPLD